MMTVQLADFNVKERSQWCPGCGNFSIVAAIKGALHELGIPTHQTVISSGIGCSSKLPHYVGTYGFEGLHGRTLPVASGIKLANHKLNVIAVGGDGDGYGIGAGHFIHIMRRNYDLVYMVHDNQIYGLTTGQASPTSQLGMKTKTTPYGVVEMPFNPVATAISGGATFVARVFAGDMVHMKETVKQAIAHKGFALVDVFQPCVTFNKLNTYDYFTKRCYKLQDSGHDTSSVNAALDKAFEAFNTNYEKIPIGVFYKADRPTYEEQQPQLKDNALVEQDLSSLDISAAYADMM
jgi:2-oxoglutarate/2-oxoacid ferredoxin oxidoreductase subunit beta